MVGLQMSSTSKTPVSNKSYRIFNAGSLPDLLNPASEEEVKQLGKIQDILMKAGECKRFSYMCTLEISNHFILYSLFSTTRTGGKRQR